VVIILFYHHQHQLYDASANFDDGSCIAVIYDCTDSSAFNYNPLANADDGSCQFSGMPCDDGNACTIGTTWSGWGICDGGSVLACDDGNPMTMDVCDPISGCQNLLMGCTDSTAFNYDSLAVVDNGSCCYVSGCTNPSSTNYNINACFDDGSCTVVVAIGDTYQGGIVFYVDGFGGGLIAAPSDQSSGAEWGCIGAVISGADGTAIGTGAQNTIDIEAGCTTSGIAADICANLTLGGYSDWFLPSKDELNEMYLNLHQQGLGGFTLDFYWSSTEAGINSAWLQSFNFGSKLDFDKDYSLYVRAVRAF